MEPRPVGDSLSMVARELRLGRADEIEAVIEAWPRVAGRLAAACVPAAVRDGVLIVTVVDSAVIESVQWHGQDWCRRLQEEVPGLVISGVSARRQTP